jgi:hypothetical protein
LLILKTVKSYISWHTLKYLLYKVNRMYQIQESQLKYKVNGFLYAELALTLLSISIAFTAFVNCYIHYHIIQRQITRNINACQHFSEVCFELRALNQTPSNTMLSPIRKKCTQHAIYEIELPQSDAQNLKRPFKLICLI